MAIFNSYVSLLEGTYGVVTDSETNTDWDTQGFCSNRVDSILNRGFWEWD